MIVDTLNGSDDLSNDSFEINFRYSHFFFSILFCINIKSSFINRTYQHTFNRNNELEYAKKLFDLAINTSYQSLMILWGVFLKGKDRILLVYVFILNTVISKSSGNKCIYCRY